MQTKAANQITANISAHWSSGYRSAYRSKILFLFSIDFNLSGGRQVKCFDVEKGN